MPGRFPFKDTHTTVCASHDFCPHRSSGTCHTSLGSLIPPAAVKKDSATLSRPLGPLRFEGKASMSRRNPLSALSPPEMPSCGGLSRDVAATDGVSSQTLASGAAVPWSLNFAPAAAAAAEARSREADEAFFAAGLQAERRGQPRGLPCGGDAAHMPWATRPSDSSMDTPSSLSDLQSICKSQANARRLTRDTRERLRGTTSWVSQCLTI